MIHTKKKKIVIVMIVHSHSYVKLAEDKQHDLLEITPAFLDAPLSDQILWTSGAVLSWALHRCSSSSHFSWRPSVFSCAREICWNALALSSNNPIPSHGPTQNSSNKTLNRSDAQHYEARISNGQPSASEDETSNPPFPALRVALQGGIYWGF